MSLVIALNFCTLDEPEARQLIDLLVDLEPSVRTDVEFWLSIRDDCDYNEAQSLIGRIKQRFHNTYLHQCLRRGRGHPHGCNEMWFDLMQRAFIHHREGWTKATGVLTFEADCVPLRKDWIDVLLSEWKIAQQQGKFVMGHLQEMPTESGVKKHINGNAVFGIDMHWKYRKWMMGCAPDCAWDLEIAPITVPNSYDTFAICQAYRMKNVTPEFLECVKKHGQRPALFHGCKGFSALRIQREALIGK